MTWWSGFNHPIGIAVDRNGFVYVVDMWNNRIKKFNNNGQFISMWGSYGYGDGQFSDNLNDVAVGPDGSVYVTEDNRIQKFDTNGNFITLWGRTGGQTGWFNIPFGVAVDRTENLYVVDSGNYRLQKFDKDGSLITKWGSPGSGDGQFSNPTGIAIASDDSIYVADMYNNRIQKFDKNGNFLTKWGSSGSGSGQFCAPSSISVGLDGMVYVADTCNNRIQKFDGNGSFITAWGSYGNGISQFINPSGIAVGTDGFVYVADTANHRVQKFNNDGWFQSSWGGNYNNSPLFQDPSGITASPDGFIYVSDYGLNRVQKFSPAGGLIATWGGTGNADGEFSGPSGLAVGSSGALYVADSENSRIQRMLPMVANAETLFEAEFPITQPQGMTQDYMTNIGSLSATGKLYLDATLKNSMGQTIANAEYPFYIIDGNTVLSFSTDKKIYKPGEMATITGQVKNLASVDAGNLSLVMKSQPLLDGAVQTTIYSDTITVPAGGSYPFTFTTTAGSEATMALIGTVYQNSLTLVEVTDQYMFTSPTVTVSMIGLDAADRNPFNLNIQITNTGTIDARVQYYVSDNQGNTIDNQSLTIPAGATMLWNYTRQIVQSTTYFVSLTGDVTQTASKAVTYGEAALISIASGGMGQTYPEGTISFPVTVTNTGFVDESVSVTYTLSPTVSNVTKTYYLPKGGSITDTLTYALTKGTYQFAASSLLPSASSSTSFIVAKDPDVAMTTTVGTQGNLIPLTLNVINSGYSVLNGSIAVAVTNNQGKTVWRGEAQVGLMSQKSMDYAINVDPTGIISGVYPTNITLYSSSGQQLAVNQAQVRVLGPIFEITSVPASPMFTVGKQAVLNFAVKNTGTLAGTASFAAKALDILNQSIGISLQPGEEKALAFNFTVPENTASKDYLTNYALSAALSQGLTGQAKFNIAGVNVRVNASLDKQVYHDNDTAALTLQVAKQTPFEDGTYMAIIRYGAYQAIQPVAVGSEPATVTFNVPLGAITRDRIFYGIYFESGTKIYQNSLSINTSPTVTIVSPPVNGTYSSTISISAQVADGGLGIGAVQYQVDNGLWNSLPAVDSSLGLYATTWTPVVADNGSHALNIRAIDTVGNMSAPVSVSFTILMDTTPSVTALTVGTPQYTSIDGKLYTAGTTTFALSATDDLSGVAKTEYRIDGGAWNPVASFTIGIEGNHLIEYHSQDNANNWENIKSLAVIVDNTPPTGSIAINNSAAYTNNTSVTLTLNCADSASGCTRMQFSSDSSPWSALEAYAVTKAWQLSSGDGEKNLYVKFADGVGNLSNAFNVSIMLDTIPPVLTLSTLPNGAYTNDATMNISGKATDNIAVQGVSINDAASILSPDGTFSQAISLITGTNTLKTIAADSAGNTTTDERTIILDQSAPVITISHPSDNSVTNNIATDVTGSVNKSATVDIKINNTSPVPAVVIDSTFSFPITFVYGQNTIEVTATDLAGNIGTAKRSVMFDNLIPALSVTNPAQDITTNQATILIQGTVADLTIATVTITFDGETFTPAVTTGTFEQQLAFIDAKTYTIVVTATDGAGNTSTIQRNIIYAPFTPYSFYGFFSPVDNSPILNSANSGQAIPVKWRITDTNGEPISDPASFKSLTSYSVNCDSFSGDITDAIEEYSEGSSGLQYQGNGNWQFNWATSTTYARQCRMMVLTFGDNSTHTAHFKFK